MASASASAFPSATRGSAIGVATTGANAGALVKVRGDAFRKPEPQVDGQDDLFGGVA